LGYIFDEALRDVDTNTEKVYNFSQLKNKTPAE
jgi:hypothetical protein